MNKENRLINCWRYACLISFWYFISSFIHKINNKYFYKICYLLEAKYLIIMKKIPSKYIFRSVPKHNLSEWYIIKKINFDLLHSYKRVQTFLSYGK